MDEFVVQDILAAGAGTEAALLRLRFDSASMMDSISTDLMNRAGASDAASGLRLVAGASVADGKTAVIRGLPDRYVSSQLNGVRLPSADEDKRAVELDQFPAAVIESIQVSKTFTPDQQGDASGGAVNVKLKGIPDETLLHFHTSRTHLSRGRHAPGPVAREPTRAGELVATAALGGLLRPNRRTGCGQRMAFWRKTAQDLIGRCRRPPTTLPQLHVTTR